MAKAKHDDRREPMACPIGRFFSRLEQASHRKNQFREHLYRSRIEFLKAIKCLIDETIEEIEKKDGSRGPKKATRIEVG